RFSRDWSSDVCSSDLSSTSLTPKSSQLNEDLSRCLTLKPQLSKEPPSTSSAITAASPFASRYMVTGCVITVGGKFSSTITTTVAVAALPLTSVTVRFTTFVPMSAQLNVST